MTRDITPKKTIICYSAFTLVELWSRQELIEKWIDFFSIYPSAVLDGYESIFQKELSTYSNKTIINPIVMLPYSIKEPGLSNKDALKKVIYDNDFIKKSEYWKNGQNEIINGILSLKKNFPPKNSKYSLEEIEEFKYLSGLYQIAIRDRDFVKSIKMNEEIIDINHFKSIVCSMYIVFYKFYTDQRKVQDSDVIDFIIGSILPYVDYFITEGNMMNIIKTLQNRP